MPLASIRIYTVVSKMENAALIQYNILNER